MKLSELVKRAKELEEKGFGDCEVIKSKDEEGNGYDTVDELLVGFAIFDDDIYMIHPDDLNEYNDAEKVINIW